MTKDELIKYWEDELTFARRRIDDNLKNKELYTALKYQMQEKSILEFLESLKQLSEETRKDSRLKICSKWIECRSYSRECKEGTINVCYKP